jgi:hypothetical protein
MYLHLKEGIQVVKARGEGSSPVLWIHDVQTKCKKDAELILQHVCGHVFDVDLILELELFHQPRLSRHGPCQGTRKLFNALPVACFGVVRHGCGLASVS